MPAQKRSHDSEDDVNVSEQDSPNDDVQQQEESGDEDESSSSSSSSSSDEDKDEFVFVKLAEVRKDVQCPICLGIIRKTRKVMECLHRFCRECIDKSMRLGNNECPACRAHCASRRSLRDDPNYDNLIAILYPDIDKYEAEELAFHEEEKARNKQIQDSIAETSRRQLEALGKKRASAKATANAFMRSLGNTRNLRGKRKHRSSEPQGSDNEVDGDNDNEVRSSSSSDEPSSEVRPKRYKRWAGGQSSLPPSGTNGGCDDNEAEGSRKMVGVSAGIVGSPEILTWGRGGMRSAGKNAKRQSASAIKNTRNSHLSRLIGHLQKLQKDHDELDINLKLISLDEQNIPNLHNSFVCCKPSVSTSKICQYVALENNLQAKKVELLLVKGGHSDIDSSASSSVSPAELSKPVVKPLMDELQLLNEHQSLLHIAKSSTQKDLTIAYRERSLS
uniref:putative E3 ubiquitin-protein ligase RING1a n=1 Tax=Erigeron canadensis TaxID=72917 RepID=UPI001CB8B8D2|nr:putative E3 ubiquitin-protein ligase RING1a [Erigeron canadensis]